MSENNRDEDPTVGGSFPLEVKTAPQSRLPHGHSNPTGEGRVQLVPTETVDVSCWLGDVPVQEWCLPLSLDLGVGMKVGDTSGKGARKERRRNVLGKVSVPVIKSKSLVLVSVLRPNSWTCGELSVVPVSDTSLWDPLK